MASTIAYNPLEIKVVTPSSYTYSDQTLINALINSDSIVPRQFQLFICQFTGGMRMGLCYLYEGTKQYGFVMVFHYTSRPRFMDVREGTAVLVEPATS